MIDQDTRDLHRLDDDGAPTPPLPLIGSFKVVVWDYHDLDTSPGSSNAVRFATIPEAEAYGQDLWSRWTGCRRWEVQSSDDPVTATWNSDTYHLDWLRP